MAKAPKKHGLDIFRTLSAIDSHDGEFYANLTTDEKKSFAAPVVMRWASSSSAPYDEWSLIAINETANQHLFDLSDHPELFYRLMASTGVGRTRHQWIPSAKRTTSGPKADVILSFFPEASPLDIEVIISQLMEGDRLSEFLNTSGLQNDEIKRIKKIFDQ